MNNINLSRLSMLALCGAALFGASATASADFTGYYDVTNWNFVTSGNGSVDTSGAPSSITLIGSNDGSGAFGWSDYAIFAEQQSVISFDWAYSSTDTPGYDDAYFYQDSVGFTKLSDTGGQSGSFSATVTAGEVIGFSVETDDNTFGAGTLTIRSFEAEPVPEPATMAALGLGLAAVARRRRNK